MFFEWNEGTSSSLLTVQYSTFRNVRIAVATVLLQLTREWVGLQKEFIGYKVWVAFLSTALVRGEKKFFAPINIESHATDVHKNVLYKAIVKTARSK